VVQRPGGGGGAGRFFESKEKGGGKVGGVTEMGAPRCIRTRNLRKKRTFKKVGKKILPQIKAFMKEKS